jgi:hypothetical protein
MEPKIQIDLRECREVHLFKTHFHKESFKHVLENMIALYNDFRASH